MEQVQILEKLIEAGDLAGALDYIETLLQEDRSKWQIQNLIGVVCSYCGQFKEAETFFASALEQQPDDLNVVYNLADTYVVLGKNRKAAELLHRYEQMKDTNEMAEDFAALHKRLTEQTSKKALMVAYYFPPLSGSGVFRSLKFAKYLPQFGWQPTVISTDQPPVNWNFTDASQVGEIPDDVAVIRIPDEISTKGKTTISSQQAESVLTFLRDILRYSPAADSIFSQVVQSHVGVTALLTFPCAALFWAYDVVRYIEENIDLDQFQVIYTTSGPASSHLAGFYLKQKYRIPWIADYRDPWTYNPYGADYDPTNPYAKLLFELESILLHQADCNLTVGEDWAQNYVKYFQISPQRVACITNGYDEADFLELAPPQRTEKFTINYAGLLYTDQRNISPILNSLRQLYTEKKIDLSQVRLRIVGNANPQNWEAAKAYGLESILVQTGYLSHKEALQSNLYSDLLLLLVGDQPRFKGVYTGKLFEYLRSGPPILALAPQGGVVDKVLRESGQGTAFESSQVDQIKAMILREYEDWKTNTPKKRKRSHSSIEKYERKYLTGKLAELFEAASDACIEPLEICSDVYNEGYLRGGAGGSYHKHYSESIDYASWQRAMKYLYLLDRSIPILEIGCGPGQFANMLFDCGFSNYTGFDYASEGIALAKKNNPEHAERFFVADAFKTELMNQTYGLVICFEVLEHIQNDLGLLERIKPGTRLLLSVPNFKDPYHVRYFASKEEVKKRYQPLMRIFDIYISSSDKSAHCLYYIAGEKL